MKSVLLYRNILICHFLCWNLFFLLINFTSPSSSDDFNFELFTYNGWAEKFGQEIADIGTKIMALNNIRTEYFTSEPRVVKIDGDTVLNEIKTKMEGVILKKVNSIKDLVATAQNAYSSHKTLKEPKFVYYNSKKLNASLEMVPSDAFHSIPVNLTYSTVHVPTYVYDESNEIMNVAFWSQKMNPAFIHNFHGDESSAWQFFCSTSGLFRSYPGIEWKTTMNTVTENVDTFDCRDRDWYLQAAAYPKDLVILLDVSGSMKGLRSQIAKATVEELLGTLNDDDFFNIIKYSDQPEYISNCSNGTLIQATDSNKIIVKELLKNPTTKGIAQLDLALKEAFQLLQMMNETKKGALCNKGIMVVSDGAVDKYEEVFNTFNSPEKKIRVFTYLIGREVSDSTNIKWIACSNNGRFSHITSLADVHEHVQDYIDVMSRPMSLKRAAHFSWTNVYSDSHDPGLGMITTLSHPVYDIKTEYGNSGVLLGVIGTDIPLKEITNLMPSYKLGVNSFSFAVTSNGYAIVHPRLKPRQPNLSDVGGAFNAIDLSDLEKMDQDQELRRSMIYMKNGSLSMKSFLTYDMGKRGKLRDSTYFFTSISQTPYSIGISLPNGYGQLKVESSKELKDYDLLSLRTNDLILAPWSYCKGLVNSKPVDHLISLVKFLENNIHDFQTINNSCDVELLKSLLYDAEVTRSFPVSWIKENWSDDGENKYGIELVFTGTKGGLTRFATLTSKLTDPFFLYSNISTIETLYYQRAVDNDEFVFTFSIPFNPTFSDMSKTVITISTPIFVPFGEQNAIVAVVGCQIKYNVFSEIFYNTTNSQKEENEPSCQNSDLVCYLLDENGYVVLSKDPKEVGVFFGSIPGMKSYMDKLIIGRSEEFEQEGVYESITYMDSQAVCNINKGQKSSANSPFIQFFQLMVIKIGVIISQILSYFLYFFTFVFQDNFSNAFLETEELTTTKFYLNIEEDYEAVEDLDYEEIVYGQRNNSKTQPCTHVLSYLSLRKERLPFVSEFFLKDGDSSCKFSVNYVPETNLILLVSQVCSLDNEKLSIEPQIFEKDYNESNCLKLQDHKERKGPEECYFFYPEENYTACKGSHRTFFSPLSIFFSIVLMWI